MGTRNNNAKKEQAEASQMMRESNALSRAQFDKTNAFVDDMQKNKEGNTAASRTLRDMGLEFLQGHLSGTDKGKMMRGQLGFVNRMAANNREASRMSRGVGGRALTGGGDANLQNQLDFLKDREDYETTADAGAEMYDAALTDAMNQAVQGEGGVNSYDQSILGALSGVAGLANENRNFAFQNKQWANRPGQGVFSKFIAPFAQTAMQGLFSLCITEDMDVLTSDNGYQVAANIRPGDMIKTLGRRGLEDCVVTDVRYGTVEKYLKIQFEGFFITCSLEHWFARQPGDVFGVEAQNLVPGDKLVLATEQSGKTRTSWLRIKNIWTIQEPVKVVNIITSSPYKNFISAGVVSLDGQE